MFNTFKYIDTVKNLYSLILLRDNIDIKIPSLEEFNNMWWVKYTFSYENNEYGYLMYLLNNLTQQADFEIIEFTYFHDMCDLHLKAKYNGPNIDTLYHRFELTFDELIYFLTMYKHNEWRKMSYEAFIKPLNET